MSRQRRQNRNDPFGLVGSNLERGVKDRAEEQQEPNSRETRLVVLACQPSPAACAAVFPYGPGSTRFLHRLQCPA